MAKTPHSSGDLQRMETHIFDEQARLILETYLEEEIDYDSNGNANMLDHLHACFIESTEVDQVTLVAPQKSMLQRLRRDIQAQAWLADYQERIHYLPVIEIMKELWP